MAGERTEQPTPKRLKEAREQGNWPRSADLAAGLGVLTAAVALRHLGPAGFAGLEAAVRRGLAAGPAAGPGGSLAADLTAGQWQALLADWLLVCLRAVAPLFGILLAVGVAGGLLQGGLLFTLRPLAPDPGRLNPLAGLRRLLSAQSAVELARSALKLALVGWLAWAGIQAALPQLPALLDLPAADGTRYLFDAGTLLLQRIGLGMTALGALDYGYQWWRHRRSLYMTREEVKEEHKLSEGRPEVRARLRQKQRELARQRKMLREVPGAAVVVTNPTHYAVALAYAEGGEAAPRVVARGRDLFALQIKRTARAHGVPVVEDRPLARALYHEVPAGAEIPARFYQAVAQLLAFLYRVRPANARGR